MKLLLTLHLHIIMAYNFANKPILTPHHQEG